MNRKGKNYLTISGIILMLYFMILSIIGAHERRIRAADTGIGMKEALSPGWYFMIFIFGAFAASLAAWFFLSKKNERSFGEVFEKIRDQLTAIACFAGGGVLSVFLGAMFIGSLPSFELASYDQPREEPSLSSALSSDASSLEPSEQPAEESDLPEKQVEQAKAVLTVADTQTIGTETVSNEPGTSSVLALDHSSITFEQAGIYKTGDSENYVDSLDYGFNAALLLAPGASVNALGSAVDTQATGAAGIAVNGQNASVSMAATNIHTAGPFSPAVLALNGGQAKISGGSFLTENSVSPVFFAKSGSVISADGAVAQSTGQDSPVFQGAGIIDAASINGSSVNGPFAYLQPGAQASLRSCTFSSASLLSNGASGLFILGSDQEERENPIALTLQSCQWNPNPTAQGASQAPSFLIRNCHAKISLQANTTPSSSPFAQVENGVMDLTLIGQSLSGAIRADGTSEMHLALQEGSLFAGSVNTDNQCPNVTLSLDASSSLSLTSDLYLSDFSNAETSGTNIQTNGYHIFVNGNPVV